MINENKLSSLDFPPCIYLNEDRQCSILNVRECTGKVCPFRRSSAEYEVSQQKWREHLNNISPERQQKISRSYYGGKKLWQEMSG